MDIRLLRYFLTIAEEGSITKAAQKLHISQPPLSKQIKLLEEELGVILFVRGKRNIQLTEAGAFLKSRAEEIISSFTLVQRQLNEYRNGYKGHIHIGAVEAVAINYLPDILKGFCDKYENISFDIWCGSTDDILHKLDKGNIDIAFIRSPYDEQKYEHFRLLTDSWALLIPEGHPLADESIGQVTAGMLEGEPVITPSSTHRSDEIHEWFNKSGIQPNISFRYNVLAIGEALVRKGMGVAVVLADCKTVADNANMICKKLSQEVSSAVNVLWSKSHFMTESTGRFVDFLLHRAETGE